MYATILIALILWWAVVSVTATIALAELHIVTPSGKPGDKEPVDIFVNGTSHSPYNATNSDSKCVVTLQVNKDGYQPVSPDGPGSTYTLWSTHIHVKTGFNLIEAQQQCTSPTGASYIHHLTHNFTAVATPAPARSGIPVPVPGLSH